MYSIIIILALLLGFSNLSVADSLFISTRVSVATDQRLGDVEVERNLRERIIFKKKLAGLEAAEKADIERVKAHEQAKRNAFWALYDKPMGLTDLLKNPSWTKTEGAEEILSEANTH